MALILLLLGCFPELEPPGEVPAVVDDAPATLSPTRLLTRASLDLRGVRPTVAELEQVEADPAAVDALVDAWLDDPRFGDRVVALFSDVYLTRNDHWFVTAAEYGLDDEPGFAAAVGEEPLRLLGEVARADLPWSEIVTADWTMADDNLLGAWPMEALDEGEGWRRARYTDGRPAAGVLSTNGFWWRYMSNTSNANRGRANAVSKVLLCTDYLTKPITFERDVDLLDPEAVSDALRTNPGCVACHHSLDPLAGYLWGFFFFDYESPLETSHYHPEREYLWQRYGGVAPAYYGEPGFGLADLGRQLAADERFPQCAVQQVTELLLQRRVTLDDSAALVAHREALLADDLNIKAAFRSVLASDAYRAADESVPGAVPAKLVTAELLATQIEDLTGFTWRYRGVDMMRTDTLGLRTLAGGVDGAFVTRPATEPMTTMVLVVERLAQAAAWYAVEQDHDNPEAARLFTEVSFAETPLTDRDAMVAQVQALHLRLFGDRVAADGPEVAANLALWQELFDVDADARGAWAGLLSVLLRDPRLLVY